MLVRCEERANELPSRDCIQAYLRALWCSGHDFPRPSASPRACAPFSRAVVMKVERIECEASSRDWPRGRRRICVSRDRLLRGPCRGPLPGACYCGAARLFMLSNLASPVEESRKQCFQGGSGTELAAFTRLFGKGTHCHPLCGCAAAAAAPHPARIFAERR